MCPQAEATQNLAQQTASGIISRLNFSQPVPFCNLVTSTYASKERIELRKYIESKVKGAFDACKYQPKKTIYDSSEIPGRRIPVGTEGDEHPKFWAGIDSAGQVFVESSESAIPQGGTVLFTTSKEDNWKVIAEPVAGLNMDVGFFSGVRARDQTLHQAELSSVKADVALRDIEPVICENGIFTFPEQSQDLDPAKREFIETKSHDRALGILPAVMVNYIDGEAMPMQLYISTNSKEYCVIDPLTGTRGTGKTIKDAIRDLSRSGDYPECSIYCKGITFNQFTGRFMPDTVYAVDGTEGKSEKTKNILRQIGGGLGYVALGASTVPGGQVVGGVSGVLSMIVFSGDAVDTVLENLHHKGIVLDLKNPDDLVKLGALIMTAATAGKFAGAKSAVGAAVRGAEAAQGVSATTRVSGVLGTVGLGVQVYGDVATGIGLYIKMKADTAGMSPEELREAQKNFWLVNGGQLAASVAMNLFFGRDDFAAARGRVHVKAPAPSLESRPVRAEAPPVRAEPQPQLAPQPVQIEATPQPAPQRLNEGLAFAQAESPSGSQPAISPRAKSELPGSAIAPGTAATTSIPKVIEEVADPALLASYREISQSPVPQMRLQAERDAIGKVETLLGNRDFEGASQEFNSARIHAESQAKALEAQAMRLEQAGDLGLAATARERAKEATGRMRWYENEARRLGAIPGEIERYSSHAPVGDGEKVIGFGMAGQRQRQRPPDYVSQNREPIGFRSGAPQETAPVSAEPRTTSDIPAGERRAIGFGDKTVPISKENQVGPIGFVKSQPTAAGSATQVTGAQGQNTQAIGTNMVSQEGIGTQGMPREEYHSLVKNQVLGEEATVRDTRPVGLAGEQGGSRPPQMGSAEVGTGPRLVSADELGAMKERAGKYADQARPIRTIESKDPVAAARQYGDLARQYEQDAESLRATANDIFSRTEDTKQSKPYKLQANEMDERAARARESQAKVLQDSWEKQARESGRTSVGKYAEAAEAKAGEASAISDRITAIDNRRKAIEQKKRDFIQLSEDEKAFMETSGETRKDLLQKYESAQKERADFIRTAASALSGGDKGTYIAELEKALAETRTAAKECRDRGLPSLADTLERSALEQEKHIQAVRGEAAKEQTRESRGEAGYADAKGEGDQSILPKDARDDIATAKFKAGNGNWEEAGEFHTKAADKIALEAKKAKGETATELRSAEYEQRGLAAKAYFEGEMSVQRADALTKQLETFDLLVSAKAKGFNAAKRKELLQSLALAEEDSAKYSLGMATSPTLHPDARAMHYENSANAERRSYDHHRALGDNDSTLKALAREKEARANEARERGAKAGRLTRRGNTFDNEAAAKEQGAQATAIEKQIEAETLEFDLKQEAKGRKKGAKKGTEEQAFDQRIASLRDEMDSSLYSEREIWADLASKETGPKKNEYLIKAGEASEKLYDLKIAQGSSLAGDELALALKAYDDAGAVDKAKALRERTAPKQGRAQTNAVGRTAQQSARGGASAKKGGSSRARGEVASGETPGDYQTSAIGIVQGERSAGASTDIYARSDFQATAMAGEGGVQRTGARVGSAETAQGGASRVRDLDTLVSSRRNLEMQGRLEREFPDAASSSRSSKLAGQSGDDVQIRTHSQYEAQKWGQAAFELEGSGRYDLARAAHMNELNAAAKEMDSANAILQTATADTRQQAKSQLDAAASRVGSARRSIDRITRTNVLERTSGDGAKAEVLSDAADMNQATRRAYDNMGLKGTEQHRLACEAEATARNGAAGHYESFSDTQFGNRDSGWADTMVTAWENRLEESRLFMYDHGSKPYDSASVPFADRSQNSLFNSMSSYMRGTTSSVPEAIARSSAGPNPAFTAEQQRGFLAKYTGIATQAVEEQVNLRSNNSLARDPAQVANALARNLETTADVYRMAAIQAGPGGINSNPEREALFKELEGLARQYATEIRSSAKGEPTGVVTGPRLAGR